MVLVSVYIRLLWASRFLLGSGVRIRRYSLTVLVTNFVFNFNISVDFFEWESKVNKFFPLDQNQRNILKFWTSFRESCRKMNRLFGKSKPKEPGPSIDDCIKGVSWMSENVLPWQVRWLMTHLSSSVPISSLFENANLQGRHCWLISLTFPEFFVFRTGWHPSRIDRSENPHPRYRTA